MKVIDMYYGDKPVIAQYLGTQLIWERPKKISLILLTEFKRSFMYISETMQLRMSTSKTIEANGKAVPWSDISVIEFNGQQFVITGCELSPGGKNVFFKLKDSQAEFERKSGWNAQKTVYFDILTKFYSGNASRGGGNTVVHR